ncbi:predicted protein [Bathycoccus prasinos]|uniref:DUF7870 domain-containing protein n=1 Tax=Bathycoccus prasinos TaxID=41875 RepID=K8F7G2_9CHLO|nr:predicted protein [Bathycoccus prasinos]CCO20775.1 predicted protein [Bathycoccus prasinos]|eukprot:XP_007508056.1 predicted protein [Bathycoccus prasinos]
MLKLSISRKKVFLACLAGLLSYFSCFLYKKLSTGVAQADAQKTVESERYSTTQLYSHTDFSLLGLKLLADTGMQSRNIHKQRAYSMEALEELYSVEPTSKSEMKRRVAKAVFLSNRVDLSTFKSLHYIDLGARTHSSSILWFKSHYPKFSKDFQITAFEADPSYSIEYEELHDIDFHNLAVWTKNETLSFGGKMGRVRSGAKCKNKCKEEGSYTVRAINFSEYLLRHVNPRDFVVMKMDIEGAEYNVVPHMLSNGVFNLIDEFFLEGHTMTLSKLEEVRHRKYEHIINMLKTIRSLGVWAHEWF